MLLCTLLNLGKRWKGIVLSLIQYNELLLAFFKVYQPYQQAYQLGYLDKLANLTS